MEKLKSNSRRILLTADALFKIGLVIYVLRIVLGIIVSLATNISSSADIVLQIMETTTHILWIVALVSYFIIIRSALDIYCYFEERAAEEINNLTKVKDEE